MQTRRVYRPLRGGGLMEKIRLETRFVTEFMRAPFNVGSVCPSSRALTQALVRMAAPSGDGLIIDLGAGSGIVTRELLLGGVPAENLLAVEISPGFRKAFAEQCPGVPMVIGDARNLGNLLETHAPGRGIRSIISSLPLRIMPDSVVAAVMRELYAVLDARGGTLVQYSYFWWMDFPLRKFGFTPRSARMVLKNVPPARVEGYKVAARRNRAA